ncbi:LPXTG cell wall anchor domain-containing protein [Clostridium gasigenes]|uniref:SpaA isopeptide-forming pilin-related protein n=1 Tax=Clostridium gasigenes TaxID=94869 RepID=UPI0016254F92|nr:SpaA isopeptide-forming pilin-related protein [Clostridium gasigenes]MBB6624220.1 LPXTG cell wall anchor domain-containing protein [Clostridium gasigenes]
MIKKSLKKSVVLLAIVSVILINALAIPVSAFTSSVLDVKVLLDKNTYSDGEEISFMVEYKVKGNIGNIKENDSLVFKLPEEFKNFKLIYPKEHFKDMKTEGDITTLTFGENAYKAVQGYIKIKALVSKGGTEEKKTIEVQVNGKLITSVDIVLKPTEPIIVDPVKPSVIVDRELLKDIDGHVGFDNDGNTIGEVSGQIVGKIKQYTIYVNEKYSNLGKARIIDNMPDGMELITESVKIIKVDRENKQIDITNDGMVSKNNKVLDIQLGDINCKYIISYESKITKELLKYTNTAVLYKDNTSIKSTVVLNKVVGEEKVLSKSSYATDKGKDKDGGIINVTSIGQVVKYRIDVNENGSSLQNVILEDIIPKGMEVNRESINIGTYDLNRNFNWITEKMKNKISVENGKIIINFGDIKDHYVVIYEMKVVSRELNYENKAKLKYNNKIEDVGDIIKYDRTAGAINAEKSVDKKQIKHLEDQKAIYSIVFDCFGLFDKDYLTVTDDIDKRLEILNIEAPEGFTTSIDKNTNIVKIINDKRPLLYRERIEIKIYVDFKNVEDGTIVRNIAKINDIPTNEVSTAKGFKFEAKKIDENDKNKVLEGARFILKDKDKNTIKEIVSDNNGMIRSYLEEPGIYYLQEIKAPKGYKIDGKDHRIEILKDDIGKVIKLKDIENEVSIINYSEIEEVVKEETTEELTGEEIKPEKIDPTKEEDVLVKPKIIKPQILVNEIEEEVKEETTTELTGEEIKPEKIEPTKEEEVLVSPEIIKSQILVEEKQEEKTKINIPNTGDSSMLGYIGVLLIGIVSLIIFNKKRK